jgi:electron transfer flavoprotein alpha subunit
MDSLIISDKCTLCGKCVEACPFGALKIVGGKVEVDGNCRMCGICIKQCPENAISISDKKVSVDKGKWRGVMVFGEYSDGALHPVTAELIGKAKELAGKAGMEVSVVLAGYGLRETAESLLKYGVGKVYVYDDKALESFRVDAYANVLTDIIGETKPSVVLVGGTSIGRSLAPRVATRFKTGLTADCTKLDIKSNTDLVQIRPAFGGNIMAQIVTAHTRPQFATVRYKVMDSAKKTGINGEVIHKEVTPEMLKSGIEVMRIQKKEKKPSITESEVLVVAGQGVKSKEDLALIQKLADLLGGQMASTRPMVEKGWLDYTRQIGLSGRTVKPKLIITCGVSGAIQFCACMNASDMIVAINSDKNAPIFKIAHYGIVGDLYKVVPQLIERIEGGVKDAV